MKHKWVKHDRRESFYEFDGIKAGIDLPSGYFWVKCLRCGSLIVTAKENFPDKCHEGWDVPVDCDEAMIKHVMEE